MPARVTNEGTVQPRGLLERVVLGLAYDGTGFRGFAPQPGRRTVAGVLADALEKVTGERPSLTCAGRTDAGVHALGQVVHADLDAGYVRGRLKAKGLPFEVLPQLARSLSRLLGPECVVFDAALAPPGFDARRSATYRRYTYDVDIGSFRDPRRRSFAWYVEKHLDLAVMRLATDALLGEHDFAGFCRRPPGAEPGPITRRVTRASWRIARDGQTLRLEIEACSFCHQMVRSIVGCLVAIGQGRGRPSDVVERLASGSRERAATIAPALGLCLVEVGYPIALRRTWREAWPAFVAAPRAGSRAGNT